MENTTDTDWSGVELTLVSGRPISFVQDLAKPTYVKRPIVEPKTDPGQEGQDVYEPTRPESSEDGPRPVHRDSATTLVGRLYGSRTESGGIFQEESSRSTAGLFVDETSRRGVEPVVEASRLGEMFRFALKTPVNLPRRRSAMLPIIHTEISGQKVAVYERSVFEHQTMSAAYLKNDTGLKTPPGPVTVYDGEALAGEALVGRMAPLDQPVVRYAVDLDIRVDVQDKTTCQVAAAEMRWTSLTWKEVTRTVSLCTIENKAREAKVLLIRYPAGPRVRLIQPKACEDRTDGECRFLVPLAAESKKQFTIETEFAEISRYGDAHMNPRAHLDRFRGADAAKDVREALQRMADMKAAADKLAADSKAAEAERLTISSGQDRLRENLKALPADHPLSKRYVERLAKEEDQIERLTQRIEQLDAEVKAKKAELEEYLSKLSVGKVPDEEGGKD